ncbi:hypothetical protein RJ641_024154 [Dillenia turbinata]|uniref:Uncharacterized protein n=1 Tax=Dillenia turbinata TaxID=194707 RepID=A0AAN8YT64_9MAGN
MSGVSDTHMGILVNTGNNFEERHRNKVDSGKHDVFFFHENLVYENLEFSLCRDQWRKTPLGLDLKGKVSELGKRKWMIVIIVRIYFLPVFSNGSQPQQQNASPAAGNMIGMRPMPILPTHHPQALPWAESTFTYETIFLDKVALIMSIKESFQMGERSQKSSRKPKVGRGRVNPRLRLKLLTVYFTNILFHWLDTASLALGERMSMRLFQTRRDGIPFAWDVITRVILGGGSQAGLIYNVQKINSSEVNGRWVRYVWRVARLSWARHDHAIPAHYIRVLIPSSLEK